MVNLFQDKTKNYIFILLLSILISCKSNQLAIVKIKDQYGCIDRTGKIIIQPVWDNILYAEDSDELLVEKDSLYGFIDREGNIKIRPKYKDAMLFYEGLAYVGNGTKFGFINTKGDTIIPFIYDDVFIGFSNGLADVTKNDSCGYINKKGKIVIPLMYEQCYPFKSDLAQVTKFNGDKILIDKKGKELNYDIRNYKNKDIWPPPNSYPGSFKTSNGQGRLNHNGDTIVPPLYKATGNVSNHMLIVQDKNNKWGAYNDEGKLKVEPQFDEIWHFYEGLANFKLHEKWGFVDRDGKIIIAPQFDYAGKFNNGLAYVEINGKSGFINQKGKFVIQPIFDINKGSVFE